MAHSMSVRPSAIQPHTIRRTALAASHCCLLSSRRRADPFSDRPDWRLLSLVPVSWNERAAATATDDVAM